MYNNYVWTYRAQRCSLYVPRMFQFKILQRRAAKTKRAVAWKKQTGYLPIHALDMTSCKTEMPSFFALTSNMACTCLHLETCARQIHQRIQSFHWYPTIG